MTVSGQKAFDSPLLKYDDKNNNFVSGLRKENPNLKASNDPFEISQNNKQFYPILEERKSDIGMNIQQVSLINDPVQILEDEKRGMI